MKLQLAYSIVKNGIGYYTAKNVNLNSIKKLL